MSKEDELRRLREARFGRRSKVATDGMSKAVRRGKALAGKGGPGRPSTASGAVAGVLGAVARTTAEVGRVPPVNEGRRRGRPPGDARVTIPVRLRDRLVGLLDEEAGRRGVTRSETIRALLWEALGGEGR